MKFEDLKSSSFDYPKWTTQEIELFSKIAGAKLENIPHKFDVEENVLVIGATNQKNVEEVQIWKDYIDRKCNSIDLPLEGPCKGKKFRASKSQKDDLELYKGKLYEGYRIITGNCFHNVFYRSLSQAIDVACEVHRGIIQVLHASDQEVSDLAAKEFGLRSTPTLDSDN